MRQVNQFVTSDPKQLSTQLSRFEQNVATEADAIRSAYDQTPVPTAPVSSGGGVYTTGQALLANTVGGGFGVTLAPPASGRPGRMVVLNNSANPLTLAPLPPATINGAASFAAGLGKTELFFDSSNWWH